MEKDPRRNETAKNEERKLQVALVLMALGLIAVICSQELTRYDTEVAERVLATLTVGPGVTEGTPVEPQFTPVPTPTLPEDERMVRYQLIEVTDSDFPLEPNQVLVMLDLEAQVPQVWVGYGTHQSSTLEIPEELVGNDDVGATLVTYPEAIYPGWRGAVLEGGEQLLWSCRIHYLPECNGTVHLINTGQELNLDDLELYLLSAGEHNG